MPKDEKLVAESKKMQGEPGLLLRLLRGKRRPGATIRKPSVAEMEAATYGLRGKPGIIPTAARKAMTAKAPAPKGTPTPRYVGHPATAKGAPPGNQNILTRARRGAEKLAEPARMAAGVAAAGMAGLPGIGPAAGLAGQALRGRKGKRRKKRRKK